MEAIDPFWSLTENYIVSPPRAAYYEVIIKYTHTEELHYDFRDFSFGRWVLENEGEEILAFLYPGGNPTEVFTKLQIELKSQG